MIIIFFGHSRKFYQILEIRAIAHNVARCADVELDTNRFSPSCIAAARTGSSCGVLATGNYPCSRRDHHTSYIIFGFFLYLLTSLFIMI